MGDWEGTLGVLGGIRGRNWFIRQSCSNLIVAPPRRRLTSQTDSDSKASGVLADALHRATSLTLLLCIVLHEFCPDCDIREIALQLNNAAFMLAMLKRCLS